MPGPGWTSLILDLVVHADPRSKCCRVQATTDKEHTKLKIEAALRCADDDHDVSLEKAGPLTWAATCSVALRLKEHVKEYSNLGALHPKRKQSRPAGSEADPGQSEAESGRRGHVNVFSSPPLIRRSCLPPSCSETNGPWIQHPNR